MVPLFSTSVMKILLIEPDEYYHSHFSETLGPLGEVVIRQKGQGIGEFLQDSPPDAVVMELLLPDRSGYEVLAEIRALSPGRFLPIIIFSEVQGLEDIQSALNLGISVYLVKGRDSVHDVKKLLLSLT